MRKGTHAVLKFDNLRYTYTYTRACRCVDLQRIISFTQMSGKPSHSVPDGGYGWVICGLVFVISLIADGITLSYGVILPEVIQHFDSCSSAAVFVGALQQGTQYFMAVLTFALANTFGCRYCMIWHGNLFCCILCLKMKSR